MDNESLSDTSTLPELSFEDLLDETPIKKLPRNLYSNDNDLLEEAHKTVNDEMLNTPGPKMKPEQDQQIVKSIPSNPESSSKLPHVIRAFQQMPTPTPPKTVQMITSDTSTATTATIAASTSQSIASKNSTNVPILLNSKIALSKTNVAPQTVVKIATTPRNVTAITSTATVTATTPASSSTSTSTSMAKATTFGTVTKIDGKTALKTSNGQIVYIQKGQSTSGISAGGIAPIRIKSVSAIPNQNPVKVTLGGNAKFVTTTTATTANIGGNKTVIQLIRSADGKLMPLKTTTASGVKNTLTLPSIAAQFAGKKIITAGGGQVVIKSAASTAASTVTAAIKSQINSTTAAETHPNIGKPIKAQKIMTSSSLVSSETTTTTTATTTTTTTITEPTNQLSNVPTTDIMENVVGSAAQAAIGTATTAGGKFLVQGTQIVVPSSQLIKLSPSPKVGDITTTVNAAASTTTITTTATTTTATTSNANSAAANGTIGKSNITSSGTPMAGALHAIQIPGKPGLQYVRVISAPKKSTISTTTTATTTSTTTTTTSTSTTTTTMPKLLNSLPPKYTVVRPNAAGKIILTQSPKSDGSPVLSPIAAGKLKTFVTVPTLRKIFDSPLASSSSVVTKSQTSANSEEGSNTIMTASGGMLRPKAKISEINSEIKRMTAAAVGGGGVGGGVGEAKKFVSGPDGKRYLVMPRSFLRTAQIQVQGGGGGGGVGVQNRSDNQQKQDETPQSQSQHQQQQMKLLNVVKTSTIASANASEGGMKSFVICKPSHSGNSSFKSISIKRPTGQQLPPPPAPPLPPPPQQQQQSKTMLERTDEDQMKMTSELVSPSLIQNNNNNRKFVPIKIKQEPLDSDDLTALMFSEDAMVRGGVRRKHCNCSKSQCLKLYCDCFANGEFCQDCTCKDCFNNLQYEDERQRAIKSCLERNPSAFKPKITTSSAQCDTRLHNKGCNCKRSGCLKNYCECFEAKIPCSSNCKCVGCRNVEDRPDLDMDPIDPKLLESITNASNATNTIARAVITSNQLSSFGAGMRRTYEKAFSKRELLKSESDHLDESDSIITNAGLRKRQHIDDEISGTAALLASPQLGDGGADDDDGVNLGAEKHSSNFITQEVIDATIQCMISQADECLKNSLPAPQIEKMVLEELGRCLVEIIDFSIRNTETSFSQN